MTEYTIVRNPRGLVHALLSRALTLCLYGPGCDWTEIGRYEVHAALRVVECQLCSWRLRRAAQDSRRG